MYYLTDIIHHYRLKESKQKSNEKVKKMKMEPKKTYMILHILTLAVIRTTGLSHYVEKLDELSFLHNKNVFVFLVLKPQTRWIWDRTAKILKS